MEKNLKINYLCRSWQGFIQQLVYLVSQGYYFCHMTEYPEKKREKFQQIDRKIIAKYGADLSKYQRAYRKRKGQACFYFIRWENCAVILHTSGQMPDFDDPDRFLDARDRKTRLSVKISELLELSVIPPLCEDTRSNKRIPATVRIQKRCFQGMKHPLAAAVSAKSKDPVLKEFKKLNGIPAWSGVIKQKRLLRDFCIREAKRHQMKLSKSDFRILTRRKVYKVWE